MAGSSCLTIDKAAYMTQELILAAISQDVINRVDISPPPFPSSLDESDEYQTTGDTVFMVVFLHFVHSLVISHSYLVIYFIGYCDTSNCQQLYSASTVGGTKSGRIPSWPYYSSNS
jgi:hypothetical protein